jgi:flagellar FliL protein
MIWSKVSVIESPTQTISNNRQPDKTGVESIGSLLSLEAFIVNLADDGGSRYLRVSMDLELKQADTLKIIEKQLPQIRDSILKILPAKYFEDIRTADGKLLLKDEIITKLNSLFGEDYISNIFFTEFVVQ